MYICIFIIFSQLIHFDVVAVSPVPCCALLFALWISGSLIPEALRDWSLQLKGFRKLHSSVYIQIYICYIHI